jgi:hypothetical protein
MMSKTETIARALGGEARSGRGWLVCCPAHEDRSPSLSLADGDGGRLLVQCFAGCEARDVLAALRERGLLADGKLAEQASRSSNRRNIPAAVAGDTPLEWSDRAERIWQAAVPIAGTPAEIYLRSRGCFIPVNADIRFLSARRS